MSDALWGDRRFRTFNVVDEKFFMLPPARIHGSCHRLQKKIAGQNLQ
jgi:hypothetical protein